MITFIENLKVGKQTSPFFDGQLYNRIFGLNDDLLAQIKTKDAKIMGDSGQNKTTESMKSPGKETKPKTKVSKKSSKKIKKVTTEEYIKHVSIREESNLTINEDTGESEDWDDIEESFETQTSPGKLVSN